MILATVLLASAGAAACLPVNGDRILASDLAAALPEFGRLPAATVIGYVPMPGATRTFGAAELMRLALRHKLSLEPRSPVCFEHRMRLRTSEEISQAMRSQPGMEAATIEFVEISRYPAPEGPLVFPRSSLPLLADKESAVVWKGYVQYAEGRRFGIWARIKISVSTSRLVAAERLEAGRPITRDQVREETGETFPLATAEPLSLDEVVGRTPRAAIPAGAPLLSALLLPETEVNQGDLVSVEVSSGSVLLRFNGEAQAGGRHGDMVPVRSPSGKSIVRTRVERRGKVRVALDGGDE